MGFDTEILQPSFSGFCPVQAALDTMALAGHEARGAVFTRREVVDFILDLAGYSADLPLHKARMLEPAMGHGDFLVPIIERLLQSYLHLPIDQRRDWTSDLSDCIRAVELHQDSYIEVRERVSALLQGHGASAEVVESLCDAWLVRGDFLMIPLTGHFTHIVGNPPYVRQELIPNALMAEYRRRYSTIYDRADIYIPFIERSLSLLAPGGKLSFICADRWMKNKYGRPLRKMVADAYHLACHVDMVDVNAFHTEVIAYPAIFVIAKEQAGATRVAAKPEIDADGLRSLAFSLTGKSIGEDSRVRKIDRVMDGDSPWLFDTSSQLALLRRLEASLPTLEEAGCKIGIGVATGADSVFIAPFASLDVESDRKLPLATTRDIASGHVHWSGMGVINPFEGDGRLVDLRRYPKLADYLETHRAAIKSRHVAKRSPTSWYRTIDRIYPELTQKPKLLIPDIKGEAHIVFEPGKLYPHHNLYFITSDAWDLRALQAVLLSDLTLMFISAYSTKMRGGYLRFQAQYLRRLRLPFWQDVPCELRGELVSAAKALDKAACNVAVMKLYKLAASELRAIHHQPKEAHAA